MVRKLILKITSTLFLLGLVRVLIDTNSFRVNNVRMETKKLSTGESLKILQISDVHHKRKKVMYKQVIKKVDELKPDILVLTGDLIDRKTRSFSSLFSFVDRLISTEVPIYYVAGNHEWDNPAKDLFFTELRKRNITILNNDSITVKIKGDIVNLVGIDDASTEREDIGKAFSIVNEKNYTVLLSHSPYVLIKYPDLPVDLVISGHTHGGQIRLPIIGAVASPGEGYFPVYDKGVFEWNTGQTLYIDSGLGTTFLPIRFLNQSQISLITINGTNQK
ncbi:metallophosphoesterase [Oceanobacillus sp. CAU 1775]